MSETGPGRVKVAHSGRSHPPRTDPKGQSEFRHLRRLQRPMPLCIVGDMAVRESIVAMCREDDGF